MRQGLLVKVERARAEYAIFLQDFEFAQGVALVVEVERCEHCRHDDERNGSSKHGVCLTLELERLGKVRRGSC